jgi:hypothetical protein
LNETLSQCDFCTFERANLNEKIFSSVSVV